MIGVTRTSIHDFNKEVGIESRQQVVLKEVKMIFQTSAVVKIEKDSEVEKEECSEAELKAQKGMKPRGL